MAIVLITGASGGFGGLMTKTLAKKGHTVYATMRGMDGKNKEKAEDFSKFADENNVVICPKELDVTNEESIKACVDSIIESDGKIDVVINNAGFGVVGLQENFTADDWQKLFDVNVFGVQRVNRAVLPHLMKEKSGLLITISSILGRMTLPFYGPYNASKWAVEAMAENYRVELSQFGVESCIVEPGGFPTSFMHNLMSASDVRDAAYGDFAKQPEEMFKSFEETLAKKPEQNPQLVADAVADLIDKPAGERPLRTVVDKMGMGAMIEPYNAELERVSAGIYGAFGMADLLKLKK